MATTGVLNGTAMAIYVNGTKVAKLLSNGFTVSSPTREVANKDSGTWTSKKPNRMSWAASGSAHFSFDAGENYSTLYALIIAQTEITCMISTQVSGDKKFTGTGLLTALDPDFPDMDNSSYSFSIEGSGALNESTMT